ncbi:MAG: hypothetical protein ACI31G_00030 [Bacilli bacterium]
MILILGNTHDDIIYFESALRDKKEEKVFNTYPLVRGTIFNQKIIILYDIYGTSLLSSVLSYVVSKEYINLIINVGKCFALTDDLAFNTVTYTKSTYMYGLNYSKEKKVKTNECPSIPYRIDIDPSLTETFLSCFNKLSFKDLHLVSEINVESEEDKKKLLKENKDNIIDGLSSSLICDSTVGAVSIISTLYSIPFISIKVVEGKLNENIDVNKYLEILKTFITVGKATIASIGEISTEHII